MTNPSVKIDNEKSVMPSEQCWCVECRIRAAIHGNGKPDAPFECDTGEALIALGNVMAEMLAFHPTKSAKRYAAELLVARKKWIDHPRVRAQQPAAGTA